MIAQLRRRWMLGVWVSGGEMMILHRHLRCLLIVTLLLHWMCLYWLDSVCFQLFENQGKKKKSVFKTPSSHANSKHSLRFFNNTCSALLVCFVGGRDQIKRTGKKKTYETICFYSAIGQRMLRKTKATHSAQPQADLPFFPLPFLFFLPQSLKCFFFLFILWIVPAFFCISNMWARCTKVHREDK